MRQAETSKKHLGHAWCRMYDRASRPSSAPAQDLKTVWGIFLRRNIWKGDL